MQARAAPPDAGTAIDNRASATYYNARIEAHESIQSHATRLTVAPLEGLSLVDDQVVPGPPSRVVVGQPAPFPAPVRAG